MRKRLVVGIALGALNLAACGSDSDTTTQAGAARTVDVEMADILFKPASLTVAKGDEVRFVFTNSGKLRHEAFIGSPIAQADHEKEMTAGGEGSSGHGGHGGDDEDSKITVEPGKTGELIHRFDEAGTIEIGCHEPGHYAAGMKVGVSVS